MAHKSLKRKVLLRLPKSLIQALHAVAHQKGKFAYEILENAVESFVSELLADILILDRQAQKKEIIRLVDLLLYPTSQGTKQSKMFQSAERKGLGLEISLSTLEQLQVLKRTCGLSRQQIVEACLVYCLRPIGAAKPKKSVLKKFLSPPIVLNINMNSRGLRDLAENHLV